MTAETKTRSDGWTESLEKLLRDLWAKGQRAAVIAKHPQMIAAGKSRNAVIGKIHRFGLNRKLTQASKPNSPRYVAKARKAGEGNYAGSVPKLRELREKMAAAEPLPKITVELDDPLPRLPSCGGVDLESLDAGMCRFPLWGGADKEGFYCGDKRADGSSYCSKHHAICRTPAAKPRIVTPFKRAA